MWPIQADLLSSSEQAGPPKPLPSPQWQSPTAPPCSSARLPLKVREDSRLQKIFFSLWLQGCSPAINLIRNQLLNCK